MTAESSQERQEGLSDAEFRAAVKEAISLPGFSPSAPYEMRTKAIERGTGTYKGGRQLEGLPWWNVYPEGHLVALAFRILRLLGTPGWEEKDKELPWTMAEIKERMRKPE